MHLYTWTFGVRVFTLSKHGAIRRWQIATRHAGASRLQEEKLKVQPRNVNTRHAPAIPVLAHTLTSSSRRAKLKSSSPTLRGYARRRKEKEKKGRRKRETPIAYRAVECDKSTKIEIGKTGVVTRAWIGSKLAISQSSLGLVPDLNSITATSSLPTDYRLRTTSHERLPTAGVARCTVAYISKMMSRRMKFCPAIIIPPEPSCVPFLHNYVNFFRKNH